jgi:tetratricopeptide (TPR) repeat protein
MLEFSISSIAKFPIPDLDATGLHPAVADLEQSRRREMLFSDGDRTALQWMAMSAEYFHDDGLTSDSDRYSSHLGIAALEAHDDRYLAKAYLWQLVCAILTANHSKLRRRFLQIQKLEAKSTDPYPRAVRMFAQSFAVQRGYPWDPSWSDNDWCEIFVSYKQAAELFETIGDFNMAIWSRLEYASSMLALGRYVTAIEWVESALRIAESHGAWKWTGRMLEVAGSAAIDQG